MTTDLTTLGSAIRRARVAAGLTQEQAAQAASVRQSDWSAVETGRRGLSLDMLDRFARSIGVSRAKLLEETDGAE